MRRQRFDGRRRSDRHEEWCVDFAVLCFDATRARGAIAVENLKLSPES
jgi:hypothetical protein